jgi:endoglucanase
MGAMVSGERTAAVAARRVRFLGLVVVAVVVAIGLAGDIPRPPGNYIALRHPFYKARLFVDDTTAAAKWQAAHQAGWLDRITHKPQARWVNNPSDIDDVPGVARLAQQRGELLVLVMYYAPNRDCGGGGAPTDDAYRAYVDRLVRALGTVRAAIIVEPDAVAAECFDGNRAALLGRTIQRLVEAGQHVYLDAGHPGWRSVGEMARRLRTAGVAQAEGFSVNVSNRQTTNESYTWARSLSGRLGNREFVIDTSRNGLGPPKGAHSYDGDWCNPPWQALGEEPTTATRRPGLAALLWIKAPGESDGYCGGETNHDFSPIQAENLIRNAPR